MKKALAFSADNLRITKGAISQTLSKLEKKGIIEKAKDPNILAHYPEDELKIIISTTLSSQRGKFHSIWHEISALI